MTPIMIIAIALLVSNCIAIYALLDTWRQLDKTLIDFVELQLAFDTLRDQLVELQYDDETYHQTEKTLTQTINIKG